MHMPQERDITHQTNASWCTLTNKDHTILILRIGPIRFEPGSGLMVTLRPHVPSRPSYLTGSLAKMVDPNRGYRPMTMPPIHDHHSVTWHSGDAVPAAWKVGDTADAVTSGRAITLAHSPSHFPGGIGDKWCPTSQQGGGLCSMSWLPRGTGKPCGKTCQPVFDAIYNDVRTPSTCADAGQQRSQACQAAATAPVDAVFEHATVYQHREVERGGAVTPLVFYLGHPRGGEQVPRDRTIEPALLFHEMSCSLFFAAALQHFRHRAARRAHRALASSAHARRGTRACQRLPSPSMDARGVDRRRGRVGPWHRARSPPAARVET
jgi:hypothetical protein